MTEDWTWRVTIGWPGGQRQQLDVECDSLRGLLEALATEDGKHMRLDLPWSDVVRFAVGRRP